MQQRSSGSTMRILGGVLIALGVVALIVFGVRVTRSFSDVRQHRLEQPKPETNPAAVRAWMSIRYIATAYRIPEDALIAQIGVPLTPEQRDYPLRRLNDLVGLTTIEDTPEIVVRVRDALQTLHR